MKSTKSPTKRREDRSDLQHLYPKFQGELCYKNVSKLYNKNMRNKEEVVRALKFAFECPVCNTDENLVRFDSCDHYHCEDCVKKMLYEYHRNECSICKQEIRAYITLEGRDAHYYDTSDIVRKKIMTSNHFSKLILQEFGKGQQSLRRSLSY